MVYIEATTCDIRRRYLLQEHVGFLTRESLGGGDTVPQDIPTYTVILGVRED